MNWLCFCYNSLLEENLEKIPEKFRYLNIL
jgi:hypothetical protein